MSDIVKVRAITERVGTGDDARFVDLAYGEEVGDRLPKKARDRLREQGAIGSREEDAAVAAAAALVVTPPDLDANAPGVDPGAGTEGVGTPEA